MVNTLDMQDLRYLNLFEKITGVSTRYCFEYNNAIIFSVPKEMIPRCLGPDARNIHRMSEILRKRIKVIPLPRDVGDIKSFIGAVVSPVTFRGLDISSNEIILTAGIQSKAALIGRNKRRLMEMQKIVKDFFKRDFRII
jgi:transcription antitermination factor NusA-like protein